MFHQFQGIQGVDRLQTQADSQSSKPTKGLHACVECQRRKIRCDGEQPCRQCMSARSPKHCVYDKHRQRVLPSRRMLEELSQSLEEYRTIFKRLYPNQDVKSLLPLSRRELCDLIEPVVEAVDTLPSFTVLENSINLEQVPTEDSEWDEIRRDRDPIPAEADDVNGLALNMDKPSSYLGVSSIKAAFVVMLKVQPQLRELLSARASDEVKPFQPETKRSPIPWTWKGQTFVDAYFKRLHIFTPMLDEAAFRADYIKGSRFDAPWLLLLNMVFAMGSIMATTSSDLNHLKYYNDAIGHLHLSAFGSSHIETVQALALLGGYYLHYINRPNMADAVIGAAIRMASALGLHRESVTQINHLSVVETRRRTWWSLFCLDTWTTTVGRPSFGRLSPTINIQPPQLSAEVNDSAQYAGIMPLLENIRFCKIATQVQDILAGSPLLKAEDRGHLDGQLVDWYNNLPQLFQTTEPCTEPLTLTRSVIKWRCLNLRMLLYRPTLLTLAGCKRLPTTEDSEAIEMCQKLAMTTIDDISNEWMRNQMSGWNGVWFLYQASMIPLVSILWQPKSSFRAEWQNQVEKALGLFESMADWSLTARRSRDVVSRIYEASCQLSCDSSLQIGGNDYQDGDIDTSPIFFQTDDMLNNMLDQEWWDIDALAWEPTLLGGVFDMENGTTGYYNCED